MKEKNDIKPQAGSLLISEPHLNDFFFERSVVLLADHSEEGSFGLIINKPLKARFNDIVKDFPSFDAPVYLGGPVKTDSLFFVHTLGSRISESSLIMDGLYWGGKLDEVQTLLMDGQISANQIRFFVGYAGWSPNQLDEEMEKHSWIVKMASLEDIIITDPLTLWQRTIRSLGQEYAIWSNYPANPILN